MTQSLTGIISLGGWKPALIYLLLVVSIAFILAFITQYLAKNYSEALESNKQEEYKPTRNDKIIAWCISIMIFVLIIAIIVLILSVLGDSMNEQVNICANCTTALSNFG